MYSFNHDIEFDSELLKYLLEHDYYISLKASQYGLDANQAILIVKKLLEGNSVRAELSDMESNYIDSVIVSLLYEVPCEGPTGYQRNDEGKYVSSCIYNSYIENELVYQSYMEERFLCKHCRNLMTS